MARVVGSRKVSIGTRMSGVWRAETEVIFESQLVTEVVQTYEFEMVLKATRLSNIQKVDIMGLEMKHQ